MVRDLVIHSNTEGVEIALLEDRRLVEFYLDRNTKSGFIAGDIYLGRVRKINPGLNAAFIDIGHEKYAFIHYSDLSPNFRSLKKFTDDVQKGKPFRLLSDFEIEPEIEKNGSIDQLLVKGNMLIFQILKEAISTKGPRLSCEITIPGRYLVLTPFINNIGISRKLDIKEERKRLMALLNSIRQKNFGLVARTNASTATEEEVGSDSKLLLEKWNLLANNLKNQNKPHLLLSEIDKSIRLLRDILNDSFNRIVVDNQKMFDAIKSYLTQMAPSMVSLLQLHQSETPLFEEFSVSKQVKGAFGKTVTMKSGAYLVLEHTEALHVIDVNSGPKVNKEIDQDQNAFNVNLEAAPEIARQLRLRDIGGIIVIDFIDMKSSELKGKLLEAMQLAMKNDKAKHSILPISRFGLMEITRQRVKEQVIIDTTEPNPRIAERVESSLLLVNKIEREILSIEKNGHNKYTLLVHPFVCAYLKKGFIPIHWKWFHLKRIQVKIIQDSSLNLLDYKILNPKTKEILFSK